MKKNTKIAALILSLMLMLSLLAGCAAGGNAAGVESASDVEKKVVQIYSWNEELPCLVEKYYIDAGKLPEDYRIEYIIYNDADGRYREVLDAALAEDKQIDLFVADMDYAEKYINHEKAVSLESIGVSRSDMEGSMYKYTIDAACAYADGEVKAATWQAAPGQYIYRADLAEKYLGVTTTEEMQALVSTWDSFIETAKLLSTNSNGACFIAPSQEDVMQCMQVERKTKWVENSLLRVDEKAEKCFDVAKEASDNKLFAGYAPLSEGWYKGMKGDEVLGYFGCPRFLDDCLIGDGEEPNCGSSFGKWKAVDGPQAFYMGGSYILSSNNALYPEIAADIIKTICLDTDTMKKIALEEKTFVNSTAAVETIIADGDVQNELLGGQDYFAAFAKAAKAVDISCRSEYDAKINAELSKAAAGYASGKTDKEAALKSFSAAVHSLYPELSAEE